MSVLVYSHPTQYLYIGEVRTVSTSTMAKDSTSSTQAESDNTTTFTKSTTTVIFIECRYPYIKNH